MPLLDRLSRRKTAGQLDLPPAIQSVTRPTTPTIAPTPVRPTVARPTGQRLAQAPTTGALGRTQQMQGVKGRLLADLPANMFIEGVNNILAGKDSSNEYANNFIRRMGRQGRTPEEIRQAFIAEQKTSRDPLMIS